MAYFHGSPIGGSTVLIPRVSEHGEALVYLTERPEHALIYAVKPVPAPFSYYPYGFAPDGRPVYTEYFPDALRLLYGGRRGYLYRVERLPEDGDVTGIRGVHTCRLPVAVDGVTAYDDLGMALLAAADEGRICLRRFAQIGEEERAKISHTLWRELREKTADAEAKARMHLFLQEHFPE